MLRHSLFLFTLLTLVTSFKTQHGVLVTKPGPSSTYGIAAYFTKDANARASMICAKSTTTDKSCRAFKDSIMTGIHMVLQDMVRGATKSPGYAIGDPDTPDTLPYDEGGRLDTRAIIAGRSDWRTNIKFPNARFGHISVVQSHTKRDAGINPDIVPEGGHDSHGPGFKISFANYHLIDPSIGHDDQAEYLWQLASDMAEDWARRASDPSSLNCSRYFGIFGQYSTMISALEIIPEIKGYGLDGDTPHDFCGPLDVFACRDSLDCTKTACEAFAAKAMAKICHPLQNSEDMPWSPSPVCNTGTASWSDVPSSSSPAVGPPEGNNGTTSNNSVNNHRHPHATELPPTGPDSYASSGSPNLTEPERYNSTSLTGEANHSSCMAP